MYTPPFFKQDRTASLKFAGERGFGTMCAFDGHKPVASPLPFYLTYAADGTPQAAFHVARHNPLLKLAGDAASWLLAVNGPRCLCVAGLVRLAGSGADLALPVGASERAGAAPVG
ncbi:putative FMN-binding regulatory protein PaiB [Bradyrhizobium sp. LM3.2]